MKRERRQPTRAEWQHITASRSMVRRVLERRKSGGGPVLPSRRAEIESR